MSNWGNLKSPREILQGLRDPKEELGLLYYEEFLNDTRRETVYNAMIAMLREALDRHISRANLAYYLIKGENVDEGKLKEFNLYGLEKEMYFRVIASNFYDALIHVTEVLLNLRYKEGNAVTGVLELLVSGVENNKSQTLERVLQKVDETLRKIFDYESEILGSELGGALKALYFGSTDERAKVDFKNLLMK